MGGTVGGDRSFEIDRLTRDNSELRETIGRLNQEIERLNVQFRSELRGGVDNEKIAEIERLTKANNDLQKTISRLNKELDRLDGEIQNGSAKRPDSRPSGGDTDRNSKTNNELHTIINKLNL